MRRTKLMVGVLLCLPIAIAARQATMAAIGVNESSVRAQLERMSHQKGDPLALSILGPRELAAAKALSASQQALLAKELSATVKAIVMSPAFMAAHEAFIAKEYKAVNHGVTVKTNEQIVAGASTKAGMSEAEMRVKREMAAAFVQLAMDMRIEDLKMMLDQSLKDWARDANRPNSRNAAKLNKLIAQGEALKPLSASNPDKFRRGFAVLKSAEAGGLDTEEALFGAQAASQKDNEQLAWDQYNLRATVKRVLTEVVAEASTVDFAAETVQKGKVRVFVNPAYEKKSATWKAMYRAGKAPTAAGLEIAKAWLNEL